MNPRDFGEQLRQRGATDGKVWDAGKSVRGWHGVGLVHLDTPGHQFPIEFRENSSTPLTGNQCPGPDQVTRTQADDGEGWS